MLKHTSTPTTIQHILSNHPDGLGARLGAMIIGIFLAKILKVPFKFTWRNSVDIECINKYSDYQRDENGTILWAGINNNAVENVFSQDFIKNHLWDGEEIKPDYGFALTAKKRNIKQLKSTQEAKGILWQSTSRLPDEWLLDYGSQSKILQELAECYKTIGFSQDYLNIINATQNIAKQFPNGFIAIHIRAGDLAYSEVRYYPSVFIEKFFPIAIAIDIIKNTDKKTAIVIFSDDINSSKHLTEYCHSQGYKNVHNIDSLVTKNYATAQRAFFEINLMANALKIYTSSNSQFSKVASMISGHNNIIFFQQKYNNTELYHALKKNIETLELPKLQMAMSFYFLYRIATELDLSTTKKISYLQKAHAYDPKNLAYPIYMIETYLASNNIQDAEAIISGLIRENLPLFISTLFSWNGCAYQQQRDFFLQQAYRLKDRAPNLCLLVSLISYGKKMQHNLLIYFYHSLKNNPQIPNNKTEIILASLNYCNSQKVFANEISQELNELTKKPYLAFRFLSRLFRSCYRAILRWNFRRMLKI